MPEAAPFPTIVRFGVFEVDLRAGELRKQGLKIRLQERPFQILTFLLENRGEVVTREELRKRLWPVDTFVDFDHSVNTAINKLRDALGDSPENPRFIETLPRHGYRFVATVDYASAGKAHRKGRAPKEPHKGRRPLAVVAVAAAAAIIVFETLFALNVADLRSRLLSRAGTGRGVSVPKIESIAVLPLENLSGDPEQEYFADGMTDALITDLGNIGALRVISRTSAMHYKGTKKTLPEIARELNVDAIVEGTVRRSGDRVRITANLLYAPSDRHLWGRSYERNLGDVLALQGEVAQDVAREVQAKLTRREQARLASAHPVNPEAYELYLKGRYEWNKRTREALNKGLEYFQRAIRVDPGYALAYSGVADTYTILGNNSFRPGGEVYPKAKAAALKALELDGSLAEAHTSLGLVLFGYDRDHSSALKEYERAIELNPNYANAHHWYALNLSEMGRSKEAIREIQLARRLDPLSARINANVVLILYAGRQYDRAIAEARKALELEPNNPAVHHYLGQVYLQSGMPREALADFQKPWAMGPAGEADAVLIEAHAMSGNREGALRMLGKLKQQSRREYISPYLVARAYVYLGEKEQAFAWLRRGLAVHDGQMDFLKVDPALDPLRSDPRFQAILRRMNFPP